ncbi:hypothetical protein X975_17834, partial [Stegodyphus mimosarum]
MDEEGNKVCDCNDGFIELHGKCVECDCGEGSECHFIKGAKACNCLNGYSYDANIGKCRVCDCGENSVGCSFKG